MKSPLLLAAVIALSPGAFAAESRNLLPEGNFEILDSGGMPEGWRLPDPNWAKNFGGKVSVESEEGDNFLRLESEGLDKLFQASFKVDLPPDVLRVRLSYRMRADIREVAENDGKGVGVTVIRWWGNAEKEQAKYAHTNWVTVSTPGWTEQEFLLDVPEGMTTLTVYPAIRFASAVADFDDIVIEPAE